MHVLWNHLLSMPSSEDTGKKRSIRYRLTLALSLLICLVGLRVYFPTFRDISDHFTILFNNFRRITFWSSNRRLVLPSLGEVSFRPLVPGANSQPKMRPWHTWHNRLYWALVSVRQTRDTSQHYETNATSDTFPRCLSDLLARRQRPDRRRSEGSEGMDSTLQRPRPGRLDRQDQRLRS